MKRFKRRVFESSIEITPLIDLVFLLIIFFLIATTTDNIKSIKINFPEAETGSKLKSEKIVITVDENNMIYVNREKYTLNQLDKYLKKLGDEKIFQINGDKKSSYNTIVKVMDLLRKNGYNKIILGVKSY